MSNRVRLKNVITNFKKFAGANVGVCVRLLGAVLKGAPCTVSGKCELEAGAEIMRISRRLRNLMRLICIYYKTLSV